MMKKSGFGEKNRMDCLIIIDDVSRIAENLQKIQVPLYLCLPYNCARESNFEKDFIAN